MGYLQWLAVNTDKNNASATRICTHTVKKKDMMKSKILLSMTFTLLFISCGSSKKTGSKKWEPGTIISTYNGGGMVPESETVIIKDSGCVYIHWHLPNKDTAAFTLSAPELDSLSARLNSARFLSMKSAATEEVIYDKPSTSITWKKGDQSHIVTDGATEKVSDNDEKQFFNLYQYILDLAKKKLVKQQ